MFVHLLDYLERQKIEIIQKWRANQLLKSMFPSLFSYDVGWDIFRDEVLMFMVDFINCVGSH